MKVLNDFKNTIIVKLKLIHIHIITLINPKHYIHYSYNTQCMPINLTLSNNSQQSSKMSSITTYHADFIYEFITVAVPLKRLHPKFVDEEDENEDFVYTSGEDDEEKEISPEEIDPRWKELLKLKNKGK